MGSVLALLKALFRGPRRVRLVSARRWYDGAERARLVDERSRWFVVR
jgi:hypothetical protein